MELASGELTGCEDGTWRTRAGTEAGFRAGDLGILGRVLRIGENEV